MSYVQILDTLDFEPLFDGLIGTTYDIYLGLIGKRVWVDFLLVIIELFSLGVTAEALRAIFDLFFARRASASAVTPSEKSSINSNRKFTTRFPMSPR